jgi:hypothetical protein
LRDGCLPPAVALSRKAQAECVVLAVDAADGLLQDRKLERLWELEHEDAGLVFISCKQFRLPDCQGQVGALLCGQGWLQGRRELGDGSVLE